MVHFIPGPLLSFAVSLVLALTPVTREVHLMGTRAQLTTYSGSEPAAQEQLEKYIGILEDTENELSVWRQDTTLSHLNATPVGEGFQADSRLFKLFEEIVFWWKESGGVFDPGIGRLLQARGFYGASATKSAEPISGMQHFILDTETERITRKADAWIDSGAFGKGEALDRVREQAQGDKAEPWIIDFGGQVMVYGRPPGKAAWTIDIAHPQRRHAAAMTLELTSGSISVSGNSERPGHIVDPHTNSPVMFSGSVVVWHESGLIADIVDTALFVMGPRRGIEWADARKIAACFLVVENGKVARYPSAEFTKRFLPSAAAAPVPGVRRTLNAFQMDSAFRSIAARTAGDNHVIARF
jgi:thiamine biosynthesis lipoprotein